MALYVLMPNVKHSARLCMPLCTRHSPPNINKDRQSASKVLCEYMCSTHVLHVLICMVHRAIIGCTVHPLPTFATIDADDKAWHRTALPPACSMHIRLPRILTCHGTILACVSEVLAKRSPSPPYDASAPYGISSSTSAFPLPTVCQLRT